MQGRPEQRRKISLEDGLLREVPLRRADRLAREIHPAFGLFHR